MNPVPQHMRALAQGNVIRVARGEQRRLLRAGEITFAQALKHPAMQTMTVYDLLVTQHRWGRDRARRLLASFDQLPLSESKRVCDLTDRQRDELLWTVTR